MLLVAKGGAQKKTIEKLVKEQIKSYCIELTILILITRV